MAAWVASIITGGVTFVLTAVGTYITARRNLQMQFDSSLRDLRIGAYKELWKDLEVFPKHARTEAPTKSKLSDFAEALRKWYFETGGLFLSVQTRTAYFALQECLQVILARQDEPSNDEREFLRVLGSRLRTAMTRDVGTRRTFIFREKDDSGLVLKWRERAKDERGRRLELPT